MNKKTIEPYFGCSFYEAWMAADIAHSGMGNLVIARKGTGGVVAGVVFLCDHFCLGIKDCFPFLESEAGFRGILNSLAPQNRLVPVEAGVAKQYLIGLVQWAKEIGFEPSRDYKFCAKVLAGIQPSTETTFEYGQNGAPHYLSGPHDTPAQIDEIMRKLDAYQERTGIQVEYTILTPELSFADFPSIGQR